MSITESAKLRINPPPQKEPPTSRNGVRQAEIECEWEFLYCWVEREEAEADDGGALCYCARLVLKWRRWRV